MEGKRAWKFYTSFLLTVSISQSLITLVKCRSLEEFADQKNYYTRDPHVVSPTSHAYRSPRHHRTPACPPPPHGGSGCSCGPSHGGSPRTSAPPSHGGYYNNPPPSPIVEPITPTPTVPINPPSTPTTPLISTPPSPPFIPVDPNTPPFNPGGSPPFIPVDPNTPSTPDGIPVSGCSCRPSHGGSPGTSTPPSHGGYYNNPPPSPTVEPITPTPTVPINPPSTPTTPSISTPPSPPFIPVDPNTPPFNPGGSPPFIPVDPNTPSTPDGIPGTFPYWSTHPTLIWGIFGYWATISGLFGPATTLPFGTNLSVQEALENTRTDGFGALYREGTASFLNSMVNRKFPFSTPEVKHAFTSSLVSEKAAAEQARIFKMANEGRHKKQ